MVWRTSPLAEGGPGAVAAAQTEAFDVAAAARQRVMKVWQTGSLRGSEVGGDWGRWVEHVLQPGASLRRRFDYLLTTLGEVDHTDLRYWVEHQVTTDIDAAAASQVLTVWDRYIRLQQHRFSEGLNPKDERSWQAALAERSRVRVQILGADWAKAFYADEEQSFAEFTQRRFAPKAVNDALPAGAASPASLDSGADASLLVPPPLASLSADDQRQLQQRRTAQFGAEAAERLRAEDLAWAAWEQRLGEARQQMQSIARAPELSALQRSQAQDAWLRERFSGSELLRAQAMLRAGS